MATMHDVPPDVIADILFRSGVFVQKKGLSGLLMASKYFFEIWKESIRPRIGEILLRDHSICLRMGHIQKRLNGFSLVTLMM
jgi:hypothetical protein